MHLSGFLCILVILVVDFDVCSFRCLLDVRNSFGLVRRLFRYDLRFAVFPFTDRISEIRQYAENVHKFS